MALTLKVDDKFKAFMQSGSLPEVSSTDNGDVLAVVEGAWAKADPILPAVSSEDNGNVLTVVEGAWAKAAPSGGGGDSLIYPVTVTATSSGSGYTYGTASHTYSEINAAIDSGKLPVLWIDFGEFKSVNYYASELNSKILFSDPLNLYLTDGSDAEIFYTVDGDGVVDSITRE